MAKGGVCGVGAEGRRVDVNLDKFGVWVPFRWRTEVEDPIEASAEEENHVSFFEGSTAGASSIQGVRVGKHAFAHGGREERDLSL